MPLSPEERTDQGKEGSAFTAPPRERIGSMPVENPTQQRKYALTKITAGDYLLPSNDRQTIWRISRYVEGPSTGIDWPKDREVWGVWGWDPPAFMRQDFERLDVDDPNVWEAWDLGMYETRQEAIAAALGIAA